MSEVKIPRLSNDCARCEGLIDTGAGSVVCPQREGCLRFKAERSATDRQSFLVIEGSQYVGACPELWRFECH